VLLLCLFLVAATGMGFLLLAFYRESATAEIKRSEAVVARACDSIRDRYATSRFDRHIGADANDPAVRRELNAASGSSARATLPTHFQPMKGPVRRPMFQPRRSIVSATSI
jgi:hypothetical protein